ncbi:MAG TPA: hypothetical protein VFW66_08995 [Gemmatimonadales bacterium]|nr:hypothetical protein [Gemmatimonadales bacterium]
MVGWSGIDRAADFDQFHAAARALAAGTDPYRLFPNAWWPFHLFYPLPAVLLALPLASFALPIARAAWIGLSAAVLCFALSRERWRLLTLASGSAVFALAAGQWTPLCLAALFLPAISGLWIAKPTIGLAAFIARPNRGAVIGGLLLLAASLAIMPAWPRAWLHSLSGTISVIPLARPGGFLLLAALVRWRRPEARLLLALAAVPQTTALYETLMLFAVPRSPRELALLGAASWVALYFVIGIPGPISAAALTAREWPILLACVWLPALALILLRPNRAEPAPWAGLPADQKPPR